MIRLRLRAPAVPNVAALDRIVADLASDVFPFARKPPTSLRIAVDRSLPTQSSHS